MKKLITILLSVQCSLFSVHSYGQWQWQNPFPCEHSLNSIQFLDQNNGWIAGDFGTIIKTEDGGNTWDLLPQPGYLNLRSLQFTDPDNGWAIGTWMYSKVIKHTEDGGMTWEEQYSLGYGQVFINDLYFTDADRGWAVGDDGWMINTTNGGDTWQPVSSGIFEDINAIFFYNQYKGWAVGDAGYVIRTINGGVTWEHQTISEFNLREIYFKDWDNGWAIGDSGVIMNTSDGGQTWAPLNSGTTSTLTSICVKGQLAWIAGSNSTILHSSDGGIVWAQQICQGSFFLKDVCFTDNNNGLAIGGERGWFARGIRLRTNDGGATWISEDRISTSQNLHDVCFYDKSKGWACADSGFIVLTTDGGYTWVEYYTGSINTLNGISFTGEDIGWVVGNQGTILKTTDGGVSWTAQQSGTNESFNDVCFTDPDNGWVVGPNTTILHTNDGGNTWIIDSTGGTLYLKSVCFVDPNNGWIAGGEDILHTADGGLNWEDQYNGSSRFYGIYFTDLDNGWTVGGHEVRMRTTDGGNTWGWKSENESLFATSSLESVFFTDPMNGWAVGWHTGGMFGAPSGDILIYTYDGGINWESVSFPTTNPLYGVTAVDAENAWIVGANGLILSALDFVVGVEDEEPVNQTQDPGFKMQVYPNPATGAVRLRYLIHDIGYLKSDLFGIDGKEIRELVDAVKMPGLHEIEIDVSDLPGGVYFIRVQDGNDVAVVKLLVGH